jgi:hypothetical protein
MEVVDIGASALSILDAGLHEGKMFSHATAYKTTTSQIPAGTSGSAVIPLGLVGSSVKSLFVRFQDGGAVSTANSINHKYDSKNPLLNQIGFNINGINYPNSGTLNPLLNPAQVFRNLQIAYGNYNAQTFQSAITPVNYAKLSAGGTATTLLANQTTQDAIWSLTSSATAQSQFFYGESLEKVCKRGINSGMNLNSSKIALMLNIASAITNSHNVYCHALQDMIIIHDVNSGDVTSLI